VGPFFQGKVLEIFLILKVVEPLILVVAAVLSPQNPLDQSLPLLILSVLILVRALVQELVVLGVLVVLVVLVEKRNVIVSQIKHSFLIRPKLSKLIQELREI
jgi:hypothetical protein